MPSKLYEVDNRLINPFEDAPKTDAVTNRFYNNQILKIESNQHPFTAELLQLLRVSRNLIDCIVPELFDEFNAYMTTAFAKLDTIDKASDEYAIYKQGLLYTLSAMEYKLAEMQGDEPDDYKECAANIASFNTNALELREKLSDSVIQNGPK